jgi:hypothetical protein
MVLKLKMRDRLDEAIKLAKEIDSWAMLSSIVGLKVHQDGAVHLGEAKDDYISRWQYAFMNDMGGDAPTKYITVLYWMDGKTPHVDKKAGNVSDTVPFEDDLIPKLEDSDSLAAKFNQQPNFKTLGGYDSDCVIYRMDKPMLPLAIVTNWKGQSLMIDPVEMEILNKTGQ